MIIDVEYINNPVKPHCVFGSAQTERGKETEREMLEWLIPNFDLHIVRHDGTKFEYDALKYLQDQAKYTSAPFFYLHTKGAYNDRKVAHRVRNMWRHEFIERQQEYIDKANWALYEVVAAPYSSPTNITWYNGWCASNAAIRNMNLIETNNRFHYEHNLFPSRTIVCAMRLNDITIEKESRAIMHADLKLNFD